MAINVTYRAGGAVVPTSTTTKNAVLLNSEIDGNFKSIKETIEGSSGASVIGLTPTGGIAATNVQAAIVELDTEKASKVDLASSGGAALVGYLPAGTGAVATDVQSKLRESVSVKDFGAVGDGVTDDTAAIQLAVDSAGTSGVYLPKGTYKVSDKINISAEGVTLVGAGRKATVIRQTDSTKDVFNVTGNYFTSRSLSVVYVSQGAAGKTAFDFNGAFYSCVSDVYVNKAGVGFKYSNSANSNQLNNFVVEDATTAGVWCFGTTANVIASNFQILNANHTLCADGCIRLENSVEGCNFVNGHTYGGATSLLTSATSLATGVSPLYNKFHAVYFDNAATGGLINNAGELDFVDCWWSARGNGLYIAAVDGVRFTGGGTFNCNQHGALIESAAGRIVFSNWMCRANSVETANTYDGILFSGTTGFVVSNCTITNSGVSLGGTQRHGIAITSACNNFSITGCNLIGNATSPLFDDTAGTTNKIIAGNLGYKTANRGVATVTVGQTVALITHGLSITPTAKDISVGFSGSPAASGVTSLWVTAITASTFQIVTNTAVTTSDLAVTWQVNALL